MKKTLYLGFGRRPETISNFLASGYIKIKFDTKIKPPILPICGDSYEEDLNFHFGR